MAAQPQCPSCGDTEHQRALPIREETPQHAADEAAYRCGKCGRLYPSHTRPKSDDE